MAEYMICIKGDMSAWNQLSPSERDQILAKYRAFTENLMKEDRFVSGAGLGDKKWVIKDRGMGVSVDGPFTESKETLTGYIIMRADSDAQAVSFASLCPALTHGEHVELFPLGH